MGKHQEDSASSTATQRTAQQPAAFDVSEHEDRHRTVHLSGDWQMENRRPPLSELLEAVTSSETIHQIKFDTSGLTSWDSSLLIFLRNLRAACDERSIETDDGGLPEGVRRLLALAAKSSDGHDDQSGPQRQTFIYRLGDYTVSVVRGTRDMISFVGEACLSLLRLSTGQARFRQRDLWMTVQQCGANALPIVSLISFLIGLILAFVGAVQLERFGAQIYVADLVAIAMAREMGAMMTAIVMAGRTGAAFAAQLGTMTVNEEIDAFQTLGFTPMDFLVLPRMLALGLMMPLLAMYANLMGVVGGTFVAVTMLDITYTQYVNQTEIALSLTDIYVGLTKAVVFGMLVALAGCLRGMQCGRSSAAVGQAATSAVVTSIVLIIVTDAVFAIVTNVLGI